MSYHPKCDLSNWIAQLTSVTKYILDKFFLLTKLSLVYIYIIVLFYMMIKGPILLSSYKIILGNFV